MRAGDSALLRESLFTLRVEVKKFFARILHSPGRVADMQANLTHSNPLFAFTDDKYHLQNYPPINSDQSQHHFALNQYKAVDHQSGQPVDEPNNNSKNNSSASSYDEAIDYDDSIQNLDLKDSQMAKKAPTDAGDGLKYIKNFANRYDEHQATYNGNANASDEYRMTNIDERKMNDDGNSSMNYASSDEMNQNAATSDHGEKLGSGSEDEGKRHCCKSIEKSILEQTHFHRRRLLEEKAPEKSNNFHDIPASRVGEGVREKSLSRRVFEGRAGDEGEPARSSGSGKFKLC